MINDLLMTEYQHIVIASIAHLALIKNTLKL